MKVKICGVCRPEDARDAARLGADYVGVILARGRKRSQTLEQAARIFAAARSAQHVGVFVDPSDQEIADALLALELDVVQLHGSEPIELVRSLAAQVSVWKAITVKAPSALLDDIATYADAVEAIVLDHGAGGSGEAFDWTEAASLRGSFPPELRIVVAGGLTPANVAAAVQTLHPHAVDVSTGVEVSLCEKSCDLMKEFIGNAKAS